MKSIKQRLNTLKAKLKPPRQLRIFDYYEWLRLPEEEQEYLNKHADVVVIKDLDCVYEEQAETDPILKAQLEEEALEGAGNEQDQAT